MRSAWGESVAKNKTRKCLHLVGWHEGDVIMEIGKRCHEERGETGTCEKGISKTLGDQHCTYSIWVREKGT